MGWWPGGQGRRQPTNAHGSMWMMGDVAGWVVAGWRQPKNRIDLRLHTPTGPTGAAARVGAGFVAPWPMPRPILTVDGTQVLTHAQVQRGLKT